MLRTHARRQKSLLSRRYPFNGPNREGVLPEDWRHTELPLGKQMHGCDHTDNHDERPKDSSG